MAGGYELGIIESITMVIVVGLSVDYSVHLVHVYQDSENDDVFDREGRVKMSLERMGIFILLISVFESDSNLKIKFKILNFQYS